MMLERGRQHIAVMMVEGYTKTTAMGRNRRRGRLIEVMMLEDVGRRNIAVMMLKGVYGT
jgi:hypothetical protein